MRQSTVSTQHSWLVVLALAVVALTTLACGFEGGAFGTTPTPPSASRVMVPVVGNAASTAPSAAALDLSGGPMEAILITSPQPDQGVRGSLHVEGVSDPALVQQLNVLVRDAQGTVIATARPVIQAQAADRSAFSADLTVPADTSQQTGRVQVYAISPDDNGVTHLASVEVKLNGDAQAAAVPIDPQTPEAIAMIFPSPNAEVKGVVKVSAATMLGPKLVIEVHDANNQIVGRVEQTVERSAGTPTQIMAEVPIKVSAAGPGRVLVYVVSERDDATEHLSSVEVNLAP
jgi:hypothetical protein